jgi:16S rRNA (adenine1518-N6/adenine1519-N6)-dimethyltransferase
MPHRPRKRFGQHFLHDPGILQRLVHSIAPQAGEHLVEIGPGQGALTCLLLPVVGEMDAVELDRDLISILSANCADLGKLHIHSADALKFDFSPLASDGRLLRIVGNLPYNISTPLIFHLLEQAAVIQDMTFMLQQEVVKRMAAQPGGGVYGRLSIMVQYRCQVEDLFNVPPEAFRPPPKVHSSVVRLTPYKTLPNPARNENLLLQIVSQAFSQRRKTIRNSLKKWFTADELQALNIDPGLRPENLEVADYVRLSNSLPE